MKHWIISQTSYGALAWVCCCIFFLIFDCSTDSLMDQYRHTVTEPKIKDWNSFFTMVWWNLWWEDKNNDRIIKRLDVSSDHRLGIARKCAQSIRCMQVTERSILFISNDKHNIPRHSIASQTRIKNSQQQTIMRTNRNKIKKQY